MITLNQRLKTLCVTDIMSGNVVVVTANNTMAEAAEILSSSGISGAPVVNEYGRCIGVLSSTDYVHSKAGNPDSNTEHLLSTDSSEGHFQIEDFQQDLVRHHMTPAVQTIASKSSILQAARCMCAEHVHRLIVIDDNSIPVGVLTSLDLIAAIVKNESDG